MKTTKTILGVVIALSCSSAFATDCGCNKPTSYDKTQDVKIGALQDRDAQLASDIHTVHMNTMTKYSESWGLEDRANIAKLQEQKLDKSVFSADQQRQDKAITAADTKAGAAYQIAQTAGGMAAGVQQNLNAAVAKQQDRDAGQDEHINAVQGAAQSANEKADGLAVRADGIERQAGVLDGRVGAVEARADNLEEGQRQQDRQMESDRQQSIDRDAVNAGAITAESQARAEANVKLAAGISNAQSTGEYAVSRSDAALRNAATNAQAIRSTNAKVAEHSRMLANHEQRLGELERNTSSRFSDIDRRIDENKRSANAGIAAVAAFANIPQVTGGARFSAGVGVGQRGSEQAVAVGFSSQLTDSVIGKVSVANDSQQQWTVGAGLAVQW